jgi:hypothetical protein
MDDIAVVNSGSDLASMAPADLFTSDAGDTGAAEGAAEETFETPASIEDAETGDEGAADADEGATGDTEDTTATTDAAEQKTEPDKQAATDEELPEGVVRGKDRNGKAGLFVEDTRWKNIYGNHQLVQRASEMLGEPATAEALQLRQDAYMAQERLFNDLTSGDPAAQGAVLEYFLDEMTRAREQGEVGVDPSVPLAQTFYSTLRDKSPDAYASLRLSAARDLVGEMFREASASGDLSLTLSVQHLVRVLAGVGKDVTDVAQVRAAAERMGLPFYTKSEVEGLARGGNDPVARLQAENARLQSLVSGKTGNDQAAQFDSWFTGTSQSVKTAVLDDAVKPALAGIEKQWKEFPNDYQDLVVDRLHRKVSETIRSDAGFNQRIKLLTDQAQRAASAQRRSEIGQTIKQAYVNRAKLAVDAVKKPILEFAANRLKERADQTHARRQNAQNRTTPAGSTGTVPRSLTPDNLIQMKDGVFDPAIAVKQAAQLLGR